MHILLVEDHADTATALSRLLRRTGHTVSVAASVADAVQVNEGGNIDLLICDIGLPDGDGRDLLRQLRGKHQRVRPSRNLPERARFRRAFATEPGGGVQCTSEQAGGFAEAGSGDCPACAGVNRVCKGNPDGAAVIYATFGNWHSSGQGGTHRVVRRRVWPPANDDGLHGVFYASAHIHSYCRRPLHRASGH